MSRDSSTLRFWLRNDRPNKYGLAPIHLVYQLRGNKRVFSIHDTSILSVNWDSQKQQAVYIDKKAARMLAPDIKYGLLLGAVDINKINGKLQQVKMDIDKIETRFRLDGKQFDCV